MSNQTFMSVNDKYLISLIERAHERIVFVAPGVRKEVAEALCHARERLAQQAVTVILDVSEEVCRLGFGDIEGLQILQKTFNGGNGFAVQKQVRVGVLISDESTLVYSPTPLCIEEEPKDSEDDEDHSVSPGRNGVLIGGGNPIQDIAAACGGDGNGEQGEIGVSPVDKTDVDKVVDRITKNPPKPFDVMRKESVFSSKLCYMELELTGYKIAARKLELPSELFVVGRDSVDRLASKFQVFDKGSLPKDVPYEANGKKIMLSFEYLEGRIRDIRKDFLINVGKWGTVMLRSRMGDFDSAINEVVDMFKTYREVVLERTKDVALASCKSLVEEVLDRVLANPPPGWGNYISQAEDRREAVKELIAGSFEEEIEKVLNEFDPQVKRIEKSISYETFTDPDFVLNISKPPPKGLGKNWKERYFEEHDTAPEKKSILGMNTEER